MSDRAAKLLSELLALPAEARAAIAGHLIDSLDGTVDEAAESAWEAELAKRTREVEDGTVKTIPWFQVRRRLFSD